MENVMRVISEYQIAEIELVYRPNFQITDRPHIISSEKAYRVLLDQWDSNTICLLERFKVMFLNTSKRVLGIYELSKGGIDSTVVDIRLLFSTALKIGASSMVLSHNHPSQNLKPSNSDKLITDKIKKAGEILDIEIVDHLIIGLNGYYSFTDEGLL